MALQRGLRLVFALIAAAVAMPWTTPSQAADLFDEIYRRGAPLEASLKTVSATFVETTSSTMLRAPIVARGTLVAERPDRVRLNYTGTDARTVVMADGSLGLDWPSRSLHDTRDIRPMLRRAQRFLTDPSPEELRKQFVIAADVAHDRHDTWVVSFTPRRKQMREGVERVVLWIDQSSLLLQAMKLEFPGGDTKLMEFADIRINPPLAAGTFAMPRK